MSFDFSHYRSAFHQEPAANTQFHKAQHKIHRLMHLFLCIIVSEWMITCVESGFSWESLLELAVAVAIHVVVETLVLRGFPVCGGLIVLLDEGSGLAALLRGGKTGAVWETAVSIACAVVLLGIGLILIFDRDIRAYARRARELLYDVFRGGAARPC